MVQCKGDTHRLSSCLISRGGWAASHLHSVNKEAVHDMQYCIQAHATGGGEARGGEGRGGEEREGEGRRGKGRGGEGRGGEEREGGEGMGGGEKEEGRGREQEQNSDIMEAKGTIASYIPLFNSDAASVTFLVSP